MKTVYLVRHGDYDYQDASLETEGQGLVEIGRQQAQLTADWFQGLNINFTALHSSDYLRARQTAHAISTGLSLDPIQVSLELRECSDIYYQDILQSPFSAEAAFAQHFSPSISNDYSYEIVVCHANLIRYFLSRINGWSKEEWRRTMVPNCSVSEVRIDTDGVLSVGILASDAHLPDELRESLDDFDW